MKGRAAALLVAGVLLAGACGTNETPVIEATPTAEETATPSPAPGPTVAIAEPEDDATIQAGDVEVSVDAEHFEVVDKLGEAAVEGEGHVHFYLDAEDIPTAPGEPAVTEEGTYHASATTSHTWTGVEPGEHTFGVQLVNNDHTPLEPPVTAEVTVTVE